MPDILKPNAKELSAYVVTARMLDENNVSVIPTSFTWTLKDIAGTVVNSRLDVPFEYPDAVNVFLLSGDDLALTGYNTKTRILTLEGFYDSTLGDNIPVSKAIQFDIDPLIAENVGGFTLKEMLDELGIYLSDLNQAESAPDEFTETQKLVALNRAQDEVLKLVKNEYTTELHTVIESRVLDSDLKFDISTLVQPIFHKGKGLLGVRIHGYRFCYKMNFGEYRAAKNSEREFQRTESVCYQRGTYIHVEGVDSSDTIDLHYMREPVKMALDPTGDHDLDINCELEQGLQDIIISYAAYVLFRYGGDKAQMRAGVAFQDATRKIDSANASTPASDATRTPEGVSMVRSGGAFDILKGRTR
jgi:hypothetical protein